MASPSRQLDNTVSFSRIHPEIKEGFDYCREPSEDQKTNNWTAFMNKVQEGGEGEVKMINYKVKSAVPDREGMKQTYL